MIKVLIIDDSQEKRARIGEVIRAVPGASSISIVEAGCIVDGKRQMLSTCFDLAVVDVRLPNRDTDVPKHQGGVELVDYVCSNSRYSRPRHIIAITAYEDARQDTLTSFADQSIVVVAFDRASTSWEVPITNQIELLLSEREQRASVYNKDIAIVTALQDPELDAILRLPYGWVSKYLLNDANEYHEGRVTFAQKTFSVVAIAAPQMGMPAAAVLTSRVISEFRPRFLLMAGIAAGVRGDVSYGEVLIADRSFDHNSGKLKEVNGVGKFLPDPFPIRLDPLMKSVATTVSDNSSALANLRSAWPGPKPENVLKVTLGAVATGASVLAVNGSLDDTKDHWRKLIGLDLETYGVFYAAENFGIPKPLVLSAKAVTDFADSEKDDRWRSYAAYASAGVINLIIEQIALLEQRGTVLVG